MVTAWGTYGAAVHWKSQERRQPVEVFVGQVQPVGVADHDVLDLAPAVDQDADLPADVGGALGQEGGELGPHHLARGDLAPVDPLQHTDLAGLEPRGVSRHFLHGQRSIM